MRLDRTCKQCNKKFQVLPKVVNRGGGNYCSLNCCAMAGFQKAVDDLPPGLKITLREDLPPGVKIGKAYLHVRRFVVKDCPICGRVFAVPPRMVSSKTCSVQCNGAFRVRNRPAKPAKPDNRLKRMQPGRRRRKMSEAHVQKIVAGRLRRRDAGLPISAPKRLTVSTFNCLICGAECIDRGTFAPRLVCGRVECTSELRRRGLTRPPIDGEAAAMIIDLFLSGRSVSEISRLINRGRGAIETFLARAGLWKAVPRQAKKEIYAECR